MGRDETSRRSGCLENHAIEQRCSMGGRQRVLQAERVFPRAGFYRRAATSALVVVIMTRIGRSNTRGIARSSFAEPRAYDQAKRRHQHLIGDAEHFVIVKRQSRRCSETRPIRRQTSGSRRDRVPVASLSQARTPDGPPFPENWNFLAGGTSADARVPASMVVRDEQRPQT